MKQPTIEEVKEYFKDALGVRCAIDNYCTIIFNGVYKDNQEGFFYTGKTPIGNGGNTDEYAILCSESTDWNYAKITKYKPKTLKNPNAKHYELWDDFEAIDVIKSSLTPEEYKGYLKGNVLKYKLRDKGQDESDKIKIKDYQNELKNV